MLVLFCLVAAVALAAPAKKRLTEAERVAQWHTKHTWPPQWNDEPPDYKKLMEDREKEIQETILESSERWENWMQYTQSRYVKTFTPLGFKLVDLPKDAHETLQKAWKAGYANWDNLRTEGAIPVIHGPDSKFIDVQPLLADIQRQILPMHEEWCGHKLKPTSIYGIRAYRNGSSLSMHVDKSYSHVISSIIHVAHEYDNDDEPWPIEIEGHDGKLYQVNLEPGQMLFYESAKCMHGRRSMFKGKYYAGLFSHYQPVDKKVWSVSTEEIINSIPPHWGEGMVRVPNPPIAGAALTVPSLRCENAPPLFTREQLSVPDL